MFGIGIIYYICSELKKKFWGMILYLYDIGNIYMYNDIFS